jgi:tRNA pseudouridine38-40 synthase
MNFKLILAYDGSDFHGWQVQPACATIQGELAAAIERVTGEQVLPQGSGRTDAGVHALAQVASCALAAPIPPENLARALNRTLPAAIRVLDAEHAPPGFHARHSARAKTYEYRIYRGEICPPWLARYAYALNWPLDVEIMQRAAGAVVGEHDFTSFAAHDPDRSQRDAEPVECDSDEDEIGSVRTIYASEFAAAGEMLTYRVRGDGFLHHMVRNLVGTLIEAGRGRIVPDEVARILALRDRRAAGPTAPARGLFLSSVEY